MVGLAKKQVLIVGNDGLQIHVLNGKNVSMFGEFSAHSETLQDDLERAFRDAGASVIVLFDVVEQQYRKEILPKVSFLDKNKVIQRKLQMAFPQHAMRSHMLMKPSGTDAESVTALFTALADSPLINTVVNAIIGSEVSVVGAGLLPLESTDMADRLAKAAHQRAQTPDDTRWSVLMTYHKTGGLRQIVIRDGELALTRMTPLPDSDPHVLADEMVREFTATLTYLSRFGYVPSDGLDLIVVSSDQVAQRLRQHDLTVTHMYPMTVSEAAQLLGFTTPAYQEGDVFADIMHAGWLIPQKKLNVPLDAPVLNKVKMARQVSKIAILLLVGAALYCGYQVANMQMNNMDEQSGVTEQRARSLALKHEVDKLSSSLNTLKYDPEKTRILLSIHDGLKQKNMDIEPTLSIILSQVNRGLVRISEINVSTEANITPEAAQEAAMAIQQAKQNALKPAVSAEGHITDGMENMAGGMAGVMSGQPAVAVEPSELVIKPIVTIRATINFSEGMAIEQAALETNEMIERLRTRLPGRDITLEEIVGNLSVTKTVEGRSEQVAADRVEGRFVKGDSVSKFTIKGMLE